MPAATIPLVVFCLDNQFFGLPLASVHSVVRAVEIVPLPKAPDIVLGVIDVRGDVVPVVNIRKRFRLPEKPLTTADQILLASAGRLEIALVTDRVKGILHCSQESIVAAQEILPGLEYVEGVVKLEDGLLLIHDLARLLSAHEERVIEGVLANLPPDRG